MRSLTINSERLRARHDAMAQFGATPRGGVIRPALSEPESQARASLLQWARARNFACGIDPIGNLFVRRNGSEAHLPPVRTGSHLDSQMPGGNFDGVYGVLAGMEVLETLEDHGVETRYPLELVVWNNEEGARFSPVTMGSAVHTGQLALEKALATRDEADISVEAALQASRAELGELAPINLQSPCSAYVEAHIEQGPVLERSGMSIGIVSGIQGIMQFAVTVKGTAAHGGTTPLGLRRDAFLASIQLVEAVRTITRDDDDVTRVTFGRFKVLPGTPNTVPSEVIFTIDLRHPDADHLEKMAQSIHRLGEIDVDGCAVDVNEMLNSAPVNFHPTAMEALLRSAMSHNVETMTLPSGATHDAKHMALVCPTGMLFIPCRDGISHHEDEWADFAAMVAGADVLLGALQLLSQERM